MRCRSFSRRRTDLNCVVGLYDDDVIDRAAETTRWSRAAVVERDDESVGAARAPRLHVPATRTDCTFPRCSPPLGIQEMGG